MSNLPKGDISQDERNNRLLHTPSPVERLRNDIITAEIDAEASDLLIARMKKLVAATMIAAGVILAADQGAQRIDPNIMSMTPEQLASKVLGREVK